MAQLLGAQRTLGRLLHESTAKDMNFDENPHTVRSLLMDQPLGAIEVSASGSGAAWQQLTRLHVTGSWAARPRPRRRLGIRAYAHSLLLTGEASAPRSAVRALCRLLHETTAKDMIFDDHSDTGVRC